MNRMVGVLCIALAINACRESPTEPNLNAIDIVSVSELNGIAKVQLRNLGSNAVTYRINLKVSNPTYTVWGFGYSSKEGQWTDEVYRPPSIGGDIVRVIVEIHNPITYDWAISDEWEIE